MNITSDMSINKLNPILSFINVIYSQIVSDYSFLSIHTCYCPFKSDERVYIFFFNTLAYFFLSFNVNLSVHFLHQQLICKVLKMQLVFVNNTVVKFPEAAETITNLERPCVL